MTDPMSQSLFLQGGGSTSWVVVPKDWFESQSLLLQGGGSLGHGLASMVVADPLSSGVVLFRTSVTSSRLSTKCRNPLFIRGGVRTGHNFRVMLHSEIQTAAIHFSSGAAGKCPVCRRQFAAQASEPLVTPAQAGLPFFFREVVGSRLGSRQWN